MTTESDRSPQGGNGIAGAVHESVVPQGTRQTSIRMTPEDRTQVERVARIIEPSEWYWKDQGAKDVDEHKIAKSLNRAREIIATLSAPAEPSAALSDVERLADEIYDLVYAHTVIKYDEASGKRCIRAALEKFATPRVPTALFDAVSAFVKRFPDRDVCNSVEWDNMVAALSASSPAVAGELEAGKDELRRLMDNIWRAEYRNEAPDWKPLPDLVGMVTQIDNMYAGVRSQRDEARATLTTTATADHPLAKMVALDEEFGLYDDESVPLSPTTATASVEVGQGDGPERIWLEPSCQPERCWHDARPEDCEEPGCEARSVEYVRVDLRDHRLALSTPSGEDGK